MAFSFKIQFKNTCRYICIYIIIYLSHILFIKIKILLLILQFILKAQKQNYYFLRYTKKLIWITKGHHEIIHYNIICKKMHLINYK